MMPYDIDPQLLNGVQQQPNFSLGQRFGNGLRSFAGNQDLALALLANSGASPQKRGFGEIFGTSMLQANQMKQGREDDAFKRQYMQAQMQQMQNNQARSQFGAISPDKFTAESIRQFEQTGKYSDLVQQPQQREAIDSAQIRNYQFRESLKTEAEKRIFDDIQRQNYDTATVAGGVGVARKGPQPSFAPLSTAAQEIDFAAQKKAAEGQAGAIGAGTGGIIADIQKKGASAKTINNVLDLADPLIDASTGSLAGAAADKVAGAFGKSLSGAEASAQLQVLQAGLMLNQPRMEGPQSDADVALYRAAAGQIGDPTVPGGIKKAALRTIRQLQQKYQDRAAQPFNLTPGAKPSTANGAGGWSIAPAD